MWSKAFDRKYGNRSFYYHGKEIPVRSLGVGSDYLGFLCSYVAGKLDWNIDNLTYSEILSCRGIGVTKARALAEALIKQGVDIPDLPPDTEHVELLYVGGGAATCSGCHAVFFTNCDAAQQLFRYCPMCGKKIKR